MKMCQDELKFVVMCINDFIATLSPAAAYSVGEQAKIAIGNIEAMLVVADPVPPVEQSVV